MAGPLKMGSVQVEGNEWRGNGGWGDRRFGGRSVRKRVVDLRRGEFERRGGDLIGAN